MRSSPLSLSLVAAVVVAVTVVVGAPRSSEACVQHAETNQLLGWAADGTSALAIRVEAGQLTHAEILPTRYEGWKYVIVGEADGMIHVKKIAVARCEAGRNATTVERVKGPLTEAKLRELAVVRAMQLVAPPPAAATTLTATFVPRKRYAEHEVEIRDGARRVATLPVPVWCVGSCLRDEDWRRWGVAITQVVQAGDRTLYVLRMRRVCNGGNAKDLWMDRVIAVPGTEPRPPRRRCRGSG